MISRQAVYQLSDGLIVNVIMASADDPAPDGCALIELFNDQPCNIGWTWDGSELRAPPEEENPEQDDE